MTVFADSDGRYFDVLSASMLADISPCVRDADGNVMVNMNLYSAIDKCL